MAATVTTAETFTLVVLEDSFCICRLPGHDGWPDWVRRLPSHALPFVSVTRTGDELSVVCPGHAAPPDLKTRSDGWRCLKLNGPLDLALTGVLLRLLKPLAEAGCPVFTMATHDTDYLLVPGHELGRAVAALRAAGHVVHD